MISSSRTLAITLPIVLVIIFILLMIVIYLAHCLYISHIHYLQQGEKIVRLENPGPVSSDFSSDEELNWHYGNFYSALVDYTRIWMQNPVLPSDQFEAHIKAILFKVPEDSLPIDKDRDMRIFPNPHEYSPAEICTLLQSDRHREDMANYIISSVLLKSVSLEEGSLALTLLPFNAGDIRALSDLKKFIRTCRMSPHLAEHLTKFWKEYENMKLYVEKLREFYFELFEVLFQPCVTTTTDLDRTKRREELYNLIDLAIAFGKTVVLNSYNAVEYRWGTRRPNGFPKTVPQLVGIDCEGKETFYWDD